MAPRIASFDCVTIPDTAASFQADELAQIACESGAKAQVATTVEDAIAAITAKFEPPYRVLICGSLYLAGHVLGQNG